MFRTPPVALISACAALAVVACTRPTARAQSTGSAPAAAGGGSACSRKLLALADVGGILSQPITGTKEMAGDNGSTCRFNTGSYTSVSVTLRPGAGKASLAVWQSGKMPVASTPMAGVGDEAVWVSELTEVVAEKNDLLCDIRVEGGTRDLAGPSAVVQPRIGALCNKIYATVK